MQGGNLSII